MLLQAPSANNTIKVFTKETCHLMAGMEPQERRQKLAGLLTAYFQRKIPDAGFPALEIAKMAGVDEDLVNKVLVAMGQKGMTGPDDAANLMNRNTPVTAGVFYKSLSDPLTDYGWEELFDHVDMRTAGQTSFDILDVTNAITFAEVKSSEAMKVYGITDAKSTVTKMIIAAAIGILDDWINYAMFWNLNQAAVEARSKYYSKMATDHYALIEASTNAEAFSTDDITTMNNAAAEILDDCEALGYNITGNETFQVRANVNLKQRVEKAFNLVFNSPGPTSPTQLVFNMERKYTTKLTATKIWVILPGRKLKSGIWSDLSAETDRDILKRGTDIAYCGEYNAAVGETEQVKECALS